jgi:hypothetical protein
MFFSTGLSTLLLALGCSAIIYDTVKDLPHRDYDYIVVGGGLISAIGVYGTNIKQEEWLAVLSPIV